MNAPSPQPSRTCGTCSLCCKLVGIEALEKPAGKWCPHCKPGTGCMIYGSHPQECRDFACLWLDEMQLGEEWKPVRSKIVLYAVDDGARLIAHVDPGSPNAWRQTPFYETLKLWSRKRMERGQQVVVRIDKRVIAVLPDREVDLGIVEKGDLLFIGKVMTAAGPRFEARKVPKSAAAGAA